MRRGDLVAVSLPGAYGKPRPAVVVQADFFAEHPSVTVLPITSAILPDVPLLRIDLEPGPQNGLKKPSQVMIDKAHTLPRERLGAAFGRLDDQILTQINRALAVFLGIA